MSASRIEATSDDLAGRTQRCENEAEILGLSDQWRDNHVRTCLARKPRCDVCVIKDLCRWPEKTA